MAKKKKSKEDDDKFPVSKERTVKGTRRLAREKILQVLAAMSDDDILLKDVFPHVFFRELTFDTRQPKDDSGRILKPSEVFELDADVPIKWSEDDLDYATTVVQEARKQRATSDALIEAHSKNWDMERMAVLDRILIRLAIAELVSCSEIPIKVTINEVIELAKRYSTDNSGNFINGILDSITTVLKKDGKISKTGRGLKE